MTTRGTPFSLSLSPRSNSINSPADGHIRSDFRIPEVRLWIGSRMARKLFSPMPSLDLRDLPRQSGSPDPAAQPSQNHKEFHSEVCPGSLSTDSSRQIPDLGTQRVDLFLITYSQWGGGGGTGEF
jgi:hypothetical protein